MRQCATLEKERTQTDFGGQRSAHDIQQKLDSLPRRQYARDGAFLSMKWAESDLCFIAFDWGIGKNDVRAFGHRSSQVFDDSIGNHGQAPAELKDRLDGGGMAHTLEQGF